MRIRSVAPVVQGLDAMSLNPMRTILSTLGVVIGVAAVVATLALSDGLETFAREQIATQTDVQSVVVASKTQTLRDGFSFPAEGYPIFTSSDVSSLRSAIDGRCEVTMTASGESVVSGPWGAPHLARVTATFANYIAFARDSLAAGRYFTDIESDRNVPVAVLSYRLATELSPTGEPTAMLGQTARVRGRPMAVIGVMQAYLGETGYTALIPVGAARSAFAGSAPVAPTMIVRAPSLEQVNATKDQVIDWLAARYRDWDSHVSVTTSLLRLQQTEAAVLIVKIVLGSLAGISLLVGGVGIMNVLLASVAERTREIGVRKAIGASQWDILVQFLAESVAIASVGSGIGTGLGLGTAFAVAAVARWRVPGARIRAVVTPDTLLVAIVSAVAIGLAFGTLPALRAARLSPIDAIHDD